jgi:uncharacterized integral membrane protein
MLRLILVSPLLLLLVLFALSNRAPVHLSLWPTGLARDVPASIAILAALALGIAFGAVMTWLPALGQRARARRAEHTLAQLEERLRARPAGPTLPPPG